MNQDSATPRWGNPTFWLLIALAFGNVFGAAELGLHRPPSEARSGPPAAHVRARLWQDPLEVGLWAMEDRSQAELDGMARESLAHLRKELRRQMDGLRESGEHVLVLPVSMRPGPHSEAHENRLRTRYAVTTALLDSLFIPEDAEHLELLLQPHEAFGIRHDADEQDGDHDHGAAGDEKVHAWHDSMLTVPYEWFTWSGAPGSGPFGAVLVAWVDEDLVGRSPLAAHEALLGLLFGPTSSGSTTELDLARVDVRLIGPTNSDGLAALLREAAAREGFLRALDLLSRLAPSAADGHAVEASFDRASPRGLADSVWTWTRRVGGIEVLSPWSTAELGELWPEEDDAGSCARHSYGPARCFPLSQVHVQRLIGKDRWLADGLIEELSLRIPAMMPLLRSLERDGTAAPSPRRPDRPWPAVARLLKGTRFLEEARRDRVRVALVAEEDSLYGRSWVKTLQRAWDDYRPELYRSIPCAGDCPCGACESACGGGDDCCGKASFLPTVEFEHIPFLRGIDGYVDGQAPALADENHEYPAGNGQIDYLRRLQQVLREDGEGFQAIGVLGTDVYDELIILQALAPLFPDTTFFTTDLDARFQSKRHRDYARNLVIASHYDLERRLAGADTPPRLRFRDSYQTSQYMAVGVALAGRRALPEELGGEEQAYLFEIGRHGALPLATWKRPGDTRLARLGKFAPMFASLTVLALVFLVLSPLSRIARRFAEQVTWPSWALFALIVSATLGCGAFLYRSIGAQYPGGEPFYWAEGVSVWPAVLVRVIGSSFCLLSLLYIAVDERRIRREIESKLLGYRSQGRSIWERAPGGSSPPQGEPNGRGRPSLAALGTFAERWRKALSRAWHHDQKDVRDLWRERYVFWSRPGWRLLRAMVFTSLFIVLLIPVFQQLGWPGSPTRGEIALLADKGSVLFFVFSLVTLIFYVMDCNWHAIRFLRDHMRDGIGDWPDELVASDDGETSETLRDLRRRHLSVQLAADLTGVVQSFVYFPAVGVCLMFASRLDLFDRWAWPSALVLAFSLVLGFLIVCAWNLSLAGREVKSTSLRLLADLRRKAGDDRSTLAAIDERFTEIEKLQGGAFAPLTQHPLVRAALLPLAFLGSGSILAYAGLLSGG